MNTIEEVEGIYQSQLNFFNSGTSRNHKFRKKQLIILRKLIQENEEALLEVLKKDLAKPAMEAYGSEIGLCLHEISFALENLRDWMKPEKVKSSLFSFPSTSRIYSQPKGISLIIAPWNYPLLLIISPLIGSIAAGNTAILKPSEKTKHTAELLKVLFDKYFPPEYVKVVLGEGHEVVPMLMENFRFDQVFFTGSKGVGKKVALMAAEKLSPVILELGGKSPAIVDKTADLKTSARRIAFGKWFNAGQTCVAPDYVLAEESIKEKFLLELKTALDNFYGDAPVEEQVYARIIDKQHYERIKNYLKDGNVIMGGTFHDEALRIAPTILDEPKMGTPVMQEEIFGPVLPVLSFKNREDLVKSLNLHSDPLALYLFTADKAMENFIVENIAFGGGMINNTILHLENINLPFGGIGQSGYGSYHGKRSFEAFSHLKPIVKSSTKVDVRYKYPPYKKSIFKIMKWIMK